MEVIVETKVNGKIVRWRGDSFDFMRMGQIVGAVSMDGLPRSQGDTTVIPVSKLEETPKITPNVIRR